MTLRTCNLKIYMLFQIYDRYKMQIKAFIIKVNDSFSVFHFYNGNIWTLSALIAAVTHNENSNNVPRV